MNTIIKNNLLIYIKNFILKIYHNQKLSVSFINF